MVVLNLSGIGVGEFVLLYFDDVEEYWKIWKVLERCDGEWLMEFCWTVGLYGLQVYDLQPPKSTLAL